jgi:hypothetical protein
MSSYNFLSHPVSEGGETPRQSDPVIREIRKLGDGLSKRVLTLLSGKSDIKKQLRLSGEISAYLKIRKSISDKMPLDRDYRSLKSELVSLDHLIAEKTSSSPR